jgi:hypothetical protein
VHALWSCGCCCWSVNGCVHCLGRCFAETKLVGARVVVNRQRTKVPKSHAKLASMQLYKSCVEALSSVRCRRLLVPWLVQCSLVVLAGLFTKGLSALEHTGFRAAREVEADAACVEAVCRRCCFFVAVCSLVLAAVGPCLRLQACNSLDHPSCHQSRVHAAFERG